MSLVGRPITTSFVGPPAPFVERKDAVVMADSRGRSFDDADAHRNPDGEADDSSAFASSTGGDGDEERSLSLESMTNVRLRRRPQRIPSSVEVEGDGDLGELSAVTLNISQPYFVPLNEREIREGVGEGGPVALVASPSNDDRKNDHKNSNELRQSKESYDIDSLIDDTSAHGNGNGEWGKMALLKQVLCEDMSDSMTEDIDIRRSLTEESLLGDASNKRRSSLFDADGGSYILSERASSFDANRTGLCLNLDSEDKDLGIEGSSCEGAQGVRSRYAATSKKRISDEGGECLKGGGDELPPSLSVGKLVTAQSYLSEEEEKDKEGSPKLLPSQSMSGGIVPGRGDRIDPSLVTAVAARGREEPNDRRSSTTTLKWKNTGKLEEKEGKVRC